jgi:hypothetical protein
MVVFEALPAKHGDCLLLRYTGDGAERLWLIDGGPPGVFVDSLKPRLDALRAHADQLRVDLAMVSHIDDDHIAGMVLLTRRLREIKDDHGIPFLDIRRFWFNSFSALVGSMPEPARKLASLAATDESHLLAELPGIRHETAAVLSSVGQGEKLTAEIVTLGVPLNERRGKPLTAPDTVMVNGASVTILGPLKSRLDDLQRAWAKQAPSAARPADLAGLFREDLDTSVPNLSSLVALVEVEGKRILLTGDARGDDIVKGWKAAFGNAPQPVPVDILKLPHHGSDRDLTEDFVRLFPARHYVISANGKFGNPDPPTLRALVETLGDRHYTIHVTGPMFQFDPDPQNPKPTQRVEQQLAALKIGRNFDFVVGQPVSISL